MKPKKEKCEAMEGLIKEGEEAVDDIEEGPVRDVALIIAAQKVEHYEISGYGSLCALAKKMGLEEAANELYSFLEEERATDEKLNTITQDINEEAYEEGEDDEADEEEAA